MDNLWENMINNTRTFITNKEYDEYFFTVDIVTALGMIEGHEFWQLKEIKLVNGLKVEYDFDSKYTRKIYNKAADGYFFLARMPNTYEGGGPDGSTKADVDACANDL